MSFINPINSQLTEGEEKKIENNQLIRDAIRYKSV